MRLERVIGAELVHRTPRSVALSTAGLALYERTAPHLAALVQAVKKLPESSQQPAGDLRLTAPHDFGAIVLPAILAQFSRRYPDIRFDVRITNARLDLIADGFDLAIRVAGPTMRNSSLTIRRLGNAGTSFYAAPAYTARRGKPKQVGDAKHEWILHPNLSTLWKVPRGTARFLCDDFFIIRDLVRDGVGVGMLPAFVADAYVRDGSIEPVAIGDRPAAVAAYVMLYPSSGEVPRKVAAFRDFLVERLKHTPLA
jgi:DNA-binding transcriptional LysR family regulator